jgi:phosphopantothenoylcysteine decarboxylase / phosphopantothenate---cysteine ligase
MNIDHPSFDITSTLSSDLHGKTVVLCICGSVAAVRCPDIARLLMRHGARVIPVMTAEAQRIIHPNLMEWATGNQVITSLSGKIEHVAVAGNVETRGDIILVAPATANTIGKIACGIDDTPVTTVVTTAFGQQIPLIVVPAMHEPMYNHPIVRQNIDKLMEHHVTILMPKIEEGKAKIAGVDEVLDAVKSILLPEHSKNSAGLQGKKVIITSGRTVEYLDPVRVITNNSTGKMGAALAKMALQSGAEVTLVYGKGSAKPPPGANVVNVNTAEDMRDAVMKLLGESKYDVVIAAAAVGDWKPKEKSAEKISTHSNKSLTIELTPTPKIIDGIKSAFPNVFLMAFRAQHDLSEEDLISDAFNRLVKAKADLIAVNDVSVKGAGFESDTNEMYVVDQNKKVEHIEMSSKDVVASRIMEIISGKIK